MKHVILIALVLFCVTGCGDSNRKAQGTETSTAQAVANVAGDELVNVYYFHGKQRCKTCMAVGDITEKAIKDLYPGNPRVRFVEVKTYESKNSALVEKYEAVWNALIIAKGNEDRKSVV